MWSPWLFSACSRVDLWGNDYNERWTNIASEGIWPPHLPSATPALTHPTASLEIFILLSISLTHCFCSLAYTQIKHNSWFYLVWFTMSTFKIFSFPPRKKKEKREKILGKLFSFPKHKLFSLRARDKRSEWM